MNRAVASALRSVVVIVSLIILLTGLMVFILSMVAPQQIATLGLGTRYLTAELSSQSQSASQMIGFKPWLDLPLLLGAYVFVCLLLWGQRWLADYFDNRRHFDAS